MILTGFRILLLFYRMIGETLNRFDRTLAILVLLQSRKLVKAQDLSLRFGVSLRTIYRDIRSLEAAGVPILGEAGVGYSIMAGYRLPPVMFTREEAGSFVAAEKLVLQFTDAGLGAYFKSAMDKVKSVLKEGEKDWVATLENGIWTVPGQEPFNKTVSNALPILFNSMALQLQVHLTYRSFAATDSQHRFIEPVGVFYENHHWYLYGFCHLRNEYRQFRTDRIVAIKATAIPFAKRHENRSELRKESANCIKTKVVIAVQKNAARYMGEGRKYYGFVGEEEKEQEVEMTFMTPSPLEGLARWYLMFGDQARILEPESFKLKVKELAEKTLAHISS